MQRMTIIGLGKTQRRIALKLYNILPGTKSYIENNLLIVETDISEEDKKHITEEYNKTGNIVLFEDI